MTETAFVVLGDVALRLDGRPVPIRGRKERAVLAVLLAARGSVVPPGRLLEDVWGPDATDDPASLHVAISRLRAQLQPDRAARQASTLLVTSDAGYALRADAVDADAFERAVHEAAAELAQHPDQALRGAEAALALWTGAPYSGAPDTADIEVERERLEALHLVALETRLAALLELGRHATVAAETVPLTAAHPFHERFWELGALALYRGARQADALALLRRARQVLADELGIDPSPALQRLEAQLLEQDPALLPPATVAAIAPVADVPIARDSEFAQLRAALTEVAGGVTRFALIEGEPGIGKTRLLEALAARTEASGGIAVWGRCADAVTSPAFAPWVEALRGLADRGIALPPGSAAFARGETEDADAAPDRRRHRLFEAAAEALATAAAVAPVTLLLEDLHWADTASAELLAHLATHLHDVPVLVVASLRELALGRTDAVTAAVAAVARRTESRRLVLRPLPAAASAALIAEVAERPVEPAVAAAIHRRSDGNPFCMGELTRLLAADGLLDAPGAVDEAAVPTAVRDVVRRRLSALPAATRSLLELAAVVGRETDLSTLIAASGQPVDDCLDALEPALVQRVVVPVPEVPGRHRFAHALVAEAALAECSSLRAARLHLRVADALAASGGDPEAIAGHRWSAGALAAPADVADACERAAAVALNRTGFERADLLLERAVAARRLASNDGRPESKAREVETVLHLAGLRRSRFGYGAAHATVPSERALSLAEQLDRPDLVMALLHLRWGADATGARIVEAATVAERMLRLGEHSEDPVLRLLAAHTWGVQCWHQARFRDGADSMERSWALLRELDAPEVDRLALYDLPTMFAAFSAHLQDLAGRADRDALFDEVLRRFPGEESVLTVANFRGYSALLEGDAAGFLTWCARRGLSGPVDARFGMFAASVSVYLGWAVAMTGRPEEGLRILEDGEAFYRGIGARTAYASFVDAHVEVLLAAGRPLHAVWQVLQEGAALVEAAGEPCAMASLDVARARLAQAEGDGAAARAALSAAAEAVERSGNVRLGATVARLTAGLRLGEPVA